MEGNVLAHYLASWAPSGSWTYSWWATKYEHVPNMQENHVILLCAHLVMLGIEFR